MPSCNAEPVEVAVTRCHQCLNGSSRVAGVDALLYRHQPTDRLAAVYDKGLARDAASRLTCAASRLALAAWCGTTALKACRAVGRRSWEAQRTAVSIQTPRPVQLLMNARRSALITSACVVHMPCDNFSYTLSVPFFSSFAESRAESAIGTI
jgi:hypothetical protein